MITNTDIAILYMGEVIKDLRLKIDQYESKIESFRQVEDNNIQLIKDLMNHIDYLNQKLDYYKAGCDSSDRLRRSVCKLRKVTKDT